MFFFTSNYLKICCIIVICSITVIAGKNSNYNDYTLYYEPMDDFEYYIPDIYLTYTDINGTRLPDNNKIQPVSNDSLSILTTTKPTSENNSNTSTNGTYPNKNFSTSQNDFNQIPNSTNQTMSPTTFYMIIGGVMGIVLLFFGIISFLVIHRCKERTTNNDNNTEKLPNVEYVTPKGKLPSNLNDGLDPLIDNDSRMFCMNS
ncbi:hypothetical protein SNEBB_000389 [Seison nebaliae]|nr:hypothetical protein SNEBB_000389 [Seison nebaliae]